jgi:ankyrin repeat protein
MKREKPQPDIVSESIFKPLQSSEIETRKMRNPLALIQAIRYNDMPIVKRLMDMDVDFNVRNKHNWTALMLASSYCNLDVVKMLLGRGVDVDARNNDGNTALILASKYGFSEIAKTLLDNGADINARNRFGRDALMLASHDGHAEMAEMLLDRGIDVNIQDMRGWSALMMASYYGHEATVKTLIDKGADVNVKNNDGWNALMMASQYGHKDIVKLLLDKGIDVNVKNINGENALKIASLFGNKETVELLKRHGTVDESVNESIFKHVTTKKEHDERSLGNFVNNCMTQLDKVFSSLERILKLRAGEDMDDADDRIDKTFIGYVKYDLFLVNGDEVKDKYGMDFMDGGNFESYGFIGDGEIWVDWDIEPHDWKFIFLHEITETHLMMGGMKYDDAHVIANKYEKRYREKCGVGINEGGSAFKCRRDAEDYCKKIRLSGLKCRPKKISSKPEYWHIEYKYDVNKGLPGADGRMNESIFKPLQPSEIESRQLSYPLSIVIAAKTKNISLVRKLIDNGCDVNVRDKSHKGWTALMFAAFLKQIEIVKMLLDAGAEPDMRSEVGDTALGLAYADGHREIKNLLKQYGAVNESVNESIFKHMTPSEIESRKMKDPLTLIRASEKNDIALVRRLLDMGADVNVKDDYGWNALMMASTYEDLDIARMLIDRGIDVNAKNNNGYNALMYASSNGHENIVRLLLDNGADVNGKNIDGETALMMASMHGDIEIIRMLLDKGADADVKDDDDCTAVKFAISIGRNDIVELLSRHMTAGKGVNESVFKPVSKEEHGKRLLHDKFAIFKAVNRNDIPLVRRLIDAGIDVDMKNESESTALMWAAEFNEDYIAMMLLGAGADPNLRNKQGETALSIAKKKNSSGKYNNATGRVIGHLIKYGAKE